MENQVEVYGADLWDADCIFETIAKEIAEEAAAEEAKA